LLALLIFSILKAIVIVFMISFAWSLVLPALLLSLVRPLLKVLDLVSSSVSFLFVLISLYSFSFFLLLDQNIAFILVSGHFLALELLFFHLFLLPSHLSQLSRLLFLLLPLNILRLSHLLFLFSESLFLLPLPLLLFLSL